MKPKTLFNGSFFVLLALMLYEAGRILWPSCGALLGAAILAIVFYPVHQGLGRYMASPSLRALVSSFFVFTFFVVPVGLLVWAAVAQSDTVMPIAKPVIEGLARWAGSIPNEILSWASGKFPWLSDQMGAPLAVLQSHFSDWIRESISWFPRLGAAAAMLTIKFAGYVSLALVALYFFFRDGEALLHQVNRLLPLDAEIKRRIESKIRQMVVGVARGSILTSVAQGIAATAGFLILRTPSAFLLGFITMLVSVIPMVGTALIWAPLSVYYFWSGAYLKGTFLLVWSLLVTGSIDNFLRPWLIGAKEDVPFLWLFFSIVGGLQVFGLFGLLIGPLVMAVLIILLDVYRHVYLGTAAGEK